jgi:pyrroline-5-carboxylate reductase
MGQSITRALVESKTIQPKQIIASNRSPGKLKRLVELLGIEEASTNEAVIERSDVIFLAVKPQDLTQAIEPLSTLFDDRHIVISLAAGYSHSRLEKLLPTAGALVRVMPNTATAIRRGVIGMCLGRGGPLSESTVMDLLRPLGQVIKVDEGEPFEALTVSCASGTGFVYELMVYFQEWLEEHGFDPEIARRMVVQTFTGAAEMAEKEPSVPLEDLRDRVVSRKGVTAAGLDSMRELEIERALRYSFEKAVLRDQEIQRGSSSN